MDDKILILVNSIRRDLEAIAAIYRELERHPLEDGADLDFLQSLT